MADEYAGTYEATMPCCQNKVAVAYSYAYYPGHMYMPNGDPGYPDDSDWNVKAPEICPVCGHALAGEEIEKVWNEVCDKAPLGNTDDVCPDDILFEEGKRAAEWMDWVFEP